MADRDAERVRAARTALLAVLGCLVVVLVAWAAIIGPQQVFDGPGPTPSSLTTTPTTDEPLDDEYRKEAEDIVRSSEVPLWLKVVVWAFEVAVLLGLVLLVLLVARALRDAWNRRTARALEERIAADVEALNAPDVAREAVTRGARAQDEALESGSPRNGIVAVWHTLEKQAAASGLRRPSETPAEFVLRLLDLAQADPGTVTELAELYREARFSDHPMGEDDRRRAHELLAHIRTGREVGR